MDCFGIVNQRKIKIKIDWREKPLRFISLLPSLVKVCNTRQKIHWELKIFFKTYIVNYNRKKRRCTPTRQWAWHGLHGSYFCHRAVGCYRPFLAFYTFGGLALESTNTEFLVTLPSFLRPSSPRALVDHLSTRSYHRTNWDVLLNPEPLEVGQRKIDHDWYRVEPGALIDVVGKYRETGRRIKKISPTLKIFQKFIRLRLPNTLSKFHFSNDTRQEFQGFKSIVGDGNIYIPSSYFSGEAKTNEVGVIRVDKEDVLFVSSCNCYVVVEIHPEIREKLKVFEITAQGIYVPFLNRISRFICSIFINRVHKCMEWV